MKKEILLGNEAVVQGALEAGVDFVSTYPGTPASEIGNTFYKISKKRGVYFEFSTNEKTAIEASMGASLAGLKCLVAMKHFGLNVALDSLLAFCYSGSKGPFVLVVADDPSCWSSGQNEQNSRAFAYLAHIPVLEPSDAQEAKDFTKLAFEISEKFKTPVILRLTTRVSHQRMPVEIIDTPEIVSKGTGKFEKNPEQYAVMPSRVLRLKKELLEKIEKVRAYAEKSFVNKVSGGAASSRLGIVTSGISYLHVKEALDKLGIDLPILKLGFFYPLPEKKIRDFLKKNKKVLVVEELEPFLEKEIKILAKEVNPKMDVFGKDLLPEIGELKPEFAIPAIAKILKIKIPAAAKNKSVVEIPVRYPQLCPGCPYWLVFLTVKKVAPEGTIFGGDIGCYMIGGLPPHNMQDYLYCMGASLGVSHGLDRALNHNNGEKKKIISFMGDGTFFHSGMPALANAVFNKSNILFLVMDNRITAMTGHQPNPGMGTTGSGEPSEELKIEKIAESLGVKNIKVLDQINTAEFETTIKEFLEKDGVSLIVARRICALLAKKQGK